MSGPRTFRSYEEFFSFYLEQHSEPGNRWMHAIGTALGLIVAIVAFATHHPWYALLWIPLGYGFAWTGHFLLEKNTACHLRPSILVVHQRFPNAGFNADRPALNGLPARIRLRFTRSIGCASC